MSIISYVGKITKVEITCTATGTQKYGPGCFTCADGQGTYTTDDKYLGTWEGEQYTVVLTPSLNQVRATQIVVTVQDEPVAFSPAPMSFVKEFSETSPIQVTFSDPEAVKYAMWELRDETKLDGDGNPEYLCGTEGAVVDGAFTCNFFNTTKLVEGHTYALTLYAYASEDDTHGDWDHERAAATYTVRYRGATEAFRYADIQLVSVTPEEKDVFVNPYQEMKLVFTGHVAELTALIAGGAGGVITPCETAATNEEQTEWKVVLPDTYLSTCTGEFTVRITAKDSTGLLVKGDFGVEASTHFEYNYSCFLGSPEFTITPASGSEVEKIDRIRVSFLGSGNFGTGISPSWNSKEKVQLTKGQELIYEFTDDDIVYPDDFDDISYLDFVVPADKVVTKAGQYQVNFPTLFFILGQDYYSASSKQQVAKYTVVGQEEVKTVNFTSDPENGSTVESISKITLTFPDEEAVSCEESAPIVITDAEGNSVGQNVALAWGAELNQLDLTCTAITTPGVYTITIPANDITDTKGNYIPADVVITLGIGTATGINATAATSARRVYNLQGQRVAQPTKGVYVVDGRKVVVK